MSFYSRFAGEYERIFPFREEVYRFLNSHAGLPGSRVLDVGCGPGHYCGRFARDGFMTTGIDLDGVMIEEAERHYPEALFRCLDMREVDALGDGYGCIYSIGNVAAHLSPEDLGRFLDKVQTMMVPGGRWIMQVMHWDPLMELDRYEFPVRSIESENRQLTFHRHYDSITQQSLSFSISLRASGTELFSERTTLYPVSIEGYLQLHAAAGFELIGVTADFIGSPVRQMPGSGLVMVFGKS